MKVATRLCGKLSVSANAEGVELQVLYLWVRTCGIFKVGVDSFLGVEVVCLW